MNRSLILTLGAAAILAAAACTPAAAEPIPTFGPTTAPVAATPTVPPTPSPTAAPTTAPTATPEPPGTKDAPRVVNVTMGNFFYEPATLAVRAGETIRFVIDNPTAIAHEFVLGDAEEQAHHAEEMAEGMDHHAGESMAPGMVMDEPNEVELEAGQSAELIWTFDLAGAQFMACHIEGHLAAGMQSTINVGP